MERYLIECLDSIQVQTFKDWECILINDGSTDSSGEICNRYAGEDPRFKVIHSPNAGLSAARNKGLSIAQGTYLGFVDSDDYIHREMYQRLYEIILEYNADVVELGITYVFKNRTRQKHLVRSIETLNRTELAVELIKSSKVPSYVCNKLFKRSIAIRGFTENILFEDMDSMAEWIKFIQKMVIVPEPYYYYRKRKGSIVNSKSIRSREDYIRARFKLIDKLKEMEPRAVTDDFVNVQKWRTLIGACKYIARNVDAYPSSLSAIYAIRSTYADIPMATIRLLGLKPWWRTRLLKNHPENFIHIMKFVHKFDFYTHHEEGMFFD